MGDSSAVAWGSVPFPPRLQDGSHSCLPLVSPPYGAETWLLEAERELRRAARTAWVACVFVVVVIYFCFSGNLCADTFRDPGNKPC